MFTRQSQRFAFFTLALIIFFAGGTRTPLAADTPPGSSECAAHLRRKLVEIFQPQPIPEHILAAQQKRAQEQAEIQVALSRLPELSNESDAISKSMYFISRVLRRDYQGFLRDQPPELLDSALSESSFNELSRLLAEQGLASYDFEEWIALVVVYPLKESLLLQSTLGQPLHEILKKEPGIFPVFGKLSDPRRARILRLVSPRVELQPAEEIRLLLMSLIHRAGNGRLNEAEYQRLIGSVSRAKI